VIQVGDRVRVKADAMDLNNEPHGMRGKTGIVVSTFSPTPAGFDCEVQFDDHDAFADWIGAGFHTPESWQEDTGSSRVFTCEAIRDSEWSDLELVQ